MKVRVLGEPVETTVSTSLGVVYIRIPAKIARLLGIRKESRFELYLAEVDGKLGFLLVPKKQRGKITKLSRSEQMLPKVSYLVIGKELRISRTFCKSPGSKRSSG